MTTRELGETLGLKEHRISEWSRKGIIPWKPRAIRRKRKDGRKPWRDYSLTDVIEALRRLGWTGGPLNDPKNVRGWREAERASGLTTCTKCLRRVPVAEMTFPGRFTSHCRSCRLLMKAEYRQSQVRDLSDAYVRERLRSFREDLPQWLIETKRAQLMVNRKIRERSGE